MKESKRDDIVYDSDHYNRAGWTPEQREWLRKRDNNACQFFELKEVEGKPIFVPCHRKGSERFMIQAHHIYPQGMQRRDPRPWGGNNPFNGIMLCTGKRGEVGHHDLMAPHMIIAKQTYTYDRTSYSRWITRAHEALEAGLNPYVQEWDGMLRAVARYRTDRYTKEYGVPFPKGIYGRKKD